VVDYFVAAVFVCRISCAAFLFLKKEKSIRFHRREAPRGVARGRRGGRVYFSFRRERKVPKEARKKGFR